MYVLGIGTGRCGTMSLSLLLSGCRESSVQHEFEAPHNALPWEFDQAFAEAKAERIRSFSGKLRGDVAFYYLNYVDFFFESLPDLRVVHIYRDKQSVVDSFLRKTEGRNHWMKNPENFSPDALWDKCFPKYEEAANKSEAIGRYYDEYMRGAAALMSRHANRLMHVNVRDLNNPNLQNLLFDFLEVPESERASQAIYSNEGGEPTGFEAEILQVASSELSASVPREETLILVDEDRCPAIRTGRSHVLPFPEKDGLYWGPPPGDAEAISELVRLKEGGARFLAFAWPAFWWLEYYRGFDRHLRSRYPCVLENERLIVYDLRHGLE